MNLGDEIPRRLIQTAKHRDLPPLARAVAVNLRLLHPDWEYRFFDDDEVEHFVRTEFPQYHDVFMSFPYRIQRFDFFRYLAVLRHGGFYFDLDVLLAESVSDLCGRGCVFPFEELTLNRHLRRQHGIDWEIGNYAFGAAPGHPFVAAIVENCVRAQKDPAWAAVMLSGIPAPFRSRFHVLNTTGPGLITRTLAEEPEAARGVTVLYPENVCDSREWHRFGRYGIHLMEASWRDRGSFLMRKAALFWERRMRRRLLAESEARGRRRTFPLPRPA
jgi:inositol phosphorylceramide mannosyltransferase catalytic subunit